VPGSGAAYGCIRREGAPPTSYASACRCPWEGRPRREAFSVKRRRSNGSHAPPWARSASELAGMRRHACGLHSPRTRASHYLCVVMQALVGGPTSARSFSVQRRRSNGSHAPPWARSASELAGLRRQACGLHSPRGRASYYSVRRHAGARGRVDLGAKLFSAATTI